MNYCVYIIKNAMGKNYIGLSGDVDKRLSDHNSGLSKYTAKFGPWELFWRSLPLSLSDARKLENLLKRQKGGGGVETILQKFSGS